MAKDNIKDSDEGRAISPVIGVVLMVAITVILAAIISGSILNLGQGTDRGPEAGIQFSETGDGNVEAVVASDQRLDNLNITVQSEKSANDGLTYNISNAKSGDYFYYCNGDVGDTITVTASFQGTDQLLQDFTLTTGDSDDASLDGSPCGA